MRVKVADPGRAGPILTNVGVEALGHRNDLAWRSASVHWSR